jgi:hypothetical protein
VGEMATVKNIFWGVAVTVLMAISLLGCIGLALILAVPAGIKTWNHKIDMATKE